MSSQKLKRKILKKKSVVTSPAISATEWKNYMDRLIQTDLSGSDMKKLCHCPVVLYPQLKKMQHLDELLGEHQAAIVLILLQSESVGHWICVFKQSPTDVMYFDPYGIAPDNEFKWISKSKRAELDEWNNEMSRLLAGSGYTIRYNQYACQNMRSHSHTCGRWCAVRLWFPKLNEEQFAATFKEEQVVYWTDYVLRNS